MRRCGLFRLLSNSSSFPTLGAAQRCSFPFAPPLPPSHPPPLFTSSSSPRMCGFSSSSSSAVSAAAAAAGKEGGGTVRPAYFDYQATTPIDPRVMDKMMPLFIEIFGNPHSRSHSYGWEAEALVEEARKEVADLIGAKPRNIIFTSGATESNNMAVKGLAHFIRRGEREREGGGMSGKKKNHIITTQIEHKCILASCRTLQEEGWNVTYLPVDDEGLVDIEELKASIRDETFLVSIMHVNNEIGVVQDLKKIGEICRKNKIFFHSDAAQGVGKLPIDVDDLNLDLVSISGHKLYGPKGIGALYVRSKPRVRLDPLISGGGQERGFRSGSLPAALVVGLGEACRIAGLEMENDEKHIRNLFEKMEKKLVNRLPHVRINGSRSFRYPGNLNISFAFVEGESLLMSLKDVALSSGSACTSASLEPSYVLRAIGVNEELAHTSLRFGIGRFTTDEEVDNCIENVVKQVEKLRSMSPLWEMEQEEEEEAKKEGREKTKRQMVWT